MEIGIVLSQKFIQLIWQMTRHGRFWIICKRQLMLHGTWVYLAALAAGPGKYP
jgi:hypothetical protein